MKLFRWHLKKRFRHTTKEIEQNAEASPQRHLCERMVNEITVSQFALYQVSTGTSTFVTVPDGDIDTYIERIKNNIREVQRDRPVPSIDITVGMKLIPLDQFLVSATGFYLDAEKAVERFKVAALKLCTLMEKTDEAESGTDEHNRRIMSKLFTNIGHVSQKLIEVSLTN